MVHAIHRVVAFDSIAPCTLRVPFEDGTEQIIDFPPFSLASLTVRWPISGYSIRSASLRPPTRCRGQMGRIVIPRHSGVGQPGPVLGNRLRLTVGRPLSNDAVFRFIRVRGESR